jgi:hypothetical protein
VRCGVEQRGEEQNIIYKNKRKIENQKLSMN